MESETSEVLTFDSSNLDQLAQFASESAKGSGRNYRIYNMIFTKGDETFALAEVNSIRAGHLRSSYRKEGWRVSMFEISNLTGVVERIPDTLNGKGVPNPVNYDSPRLHRRAHSAAAKIRIAMLNKENHRLLREAIRKQNNICRVYEESTNKLLMSGSMEEVAQFLVTASANPDFDPKNYVLYLPEKEMK